MPRASAARVLLPSCSLRHWDEEALDLFQHVFERALLRRDAIDDAFGLTHVRRQQIGRDEVIGLDLNAKSLHFVFKLARCPASCSWLAATACRE